MKCNFREICVNISHIDSQPLVERFWQSRSTRSERQFLSLDVHSWRRILSGNAFKKCSEDGNESHFLAHINRSQNGCHLCHFYVLRSLLTSDELWDNSSQKYKKYLKLYLSHANLVFFNLLWEHYTNISPLLHALYYPGKVLMNGDLARLLAAEASRRRQRIDLSYIISFCSPNSW
jgi:hypothetical protein